MAHFKFEKALKFVKLWTNRYPELASRLERALFMLGNVQPTLHVDIYKVRSENSKKVYVVRINRQARSSSCSCPDTQKGNHCKHRLAVALFEKTL